MAEPHSAPAGNRPDQPARRQFRAGRAAAAPPAWFPLLLLAGFAPAGAASEFCCRRPAPGRNGLRRRSASVAACASGAVPTAHLKLLPTGSSAAGTPHFDARTVPCETCNDIPLPGGRPTGALDPRPDRHRRRPHGHRRGGQPGKLPQPAGDALRRLLPRLPLEGPGDHHGKPQDDRGRRVFVPTVHSVACTGCGKCEYACVPDVAAIRVVPLAQAKAGLRRGEVPGDPPGRLARAVRRRRIPADRSCRRGPPGRPGHNRQGLVGGPSLAAPAPQQPVGPSRRIPGRSPGRVLALDGNFAASVVLGGSAWPNPLSSPSSRRRLPPAAGRNQRCPDPGGGSTPSGGRLSALGMPGQSGHRRRRPAPPPARPARRRTRRAPSATGCWPGAGRGGSRRRPALGKRQPVTAAAGGAVRQRQRPCRHRRRFFTICWSPSAAGAATSVRWGVLLRDRPVLPGPGERPEAPGLYRLRRLPVTWSAPNPRSSNRRSRAGALRHPQPQLHQLRPLHRRLREKVFTVALRFDRRVDGPPPAPARSKKPA